MVERRTVRHTDQAFAPASTRPSRQSGRASRGGSRDTAPVSETAQDLFREMLRTEIGPLLRDLGFVGSRQAFRLPTPSGYALLGFQKSTTSTRESVKFTVNLRVYTEDEWDYVGSPGTEPSPNMGYLAGWEERIGNVLPARADRWWTLTTTTRDAVVADLRSALQEHAVPALKERAASLLP